MRAAKRINIGILAHVDAGKTTLAEALLLKSGSIRKAGRVDHGDAFLDTYALEKERGITIFSKQAQLAFDDMQVTLLDTPGHVDFSAEMERTLQVLDYALLVISGADGVQGHVMTLWRLLEHYQVPVLLFVNKMDQPGCDREALMQELKDRLGEGCVDYDAEDREAFAEEAALCDEEMMERYLDGEPITEEMIGEMFRARKLFPCLFGSALRMQGVDELIMHMHTLMTPPVYPDAFAARVYKIARMDGQRLTFMKITGGSLKVKQMIGEQKADQIRIYSGEKYAPVPEAEAGTVCAVTGLTDTYAGQGLGAEQGQARPALESVLSYALVFPAGTDMHKAYTDLKGLEEEIPEMNLVLSPSGLIHAQVMGEVQIEILQRLIEERFAYTVQFNEGDIVYKETIAEAMEGVGHFEPLRHYAEVHLLMEPGERGSGLVLATDVSTDDLEVNWQNLVLTHLAEKPHCGTLVGGRLTDVRITLVAGRAHLKHTEGGDFREATYRAVRQGLMEARALGQCVLLEPVYGYRLEVPESQVGRAMTDIQAMHGSWDGPFTENGLSVLRGRAPVATMRNYQRQVTAYTGGEGRLTVFPDGYEPCHNTEEIVESYGYEPEADMANPSGSVFCSHGAGIYVPWDQVKAHAHLSLLFGEEKEEVEEVPVFRANVVPADIQDDNELREIFERTYGSIKKERAAWKKSRNYGSAPTKMRPAAPSKPACLLVDGYNIIFAWDELKELAKENLEAARGRLMDILSNYQGYRKMTLILVFDAYKVEGGEQEYLRYHNIYVVYTKEAETADSYIERTVHEMADKYEITVATSDAAEQVIIWGKGGRRMSAKELQEDVISSMQEIRTTYLQKESSGKAYLFDQVDEKLSDQLERMRLGHAQFSQENAQTEV